MTPTTAASHRVFISSSGAAQAKVPSALPTDDTYALRNLQ